MGYMDDEEREDYLVLSVEAIRKGNDIATKETEPSG